MLEEQKRFLENSINDIFTKKDYFNDKKISIEHDLFLKQLDFLLQISSLTIGVLGVTFFFRTHDLNTCFMWLAIIFSIGNILLITSYIRSSIDERSASVIKYIDQITKKLDEALESIRISFQNDNFNLYLNHAKKELETKYSENSMNYAGEIFTFLFFNSLFFVISTNLFANNLLLYKQIILILGIMSCSAFLSFYSTVYKLIMHISKLLVKLIKT